GLSSILECVFIDELFILRPRDISNCTYGYPYHGTSRAALRIFSDAFSNVTTIPQHIDAATNADLSFGGSPILPTMLLGTIAIHNYLDTTTIEDIRTHNQARLRMLLEPDDIGHTPERSPVPSHWRLHNINYLTTLTHYRDQDVVHCLRDGFPQLETIPSGNLFPRAPNPKLARGDKSSMQFSDRDASAITHYLLRTPPTDPEMRKAVITDVLDECSKGKALGPFPLSQWKSHCKFCSPVFPIRQSDKIRLISNYSYRIKGTGRYGKSGYCFNDFTTTYHKVSLPRLAHVALATSLLGDSTKYISRTDLEGAYRQVKMQPADTAYSAGIEFIMEYCTGARIKHSKDIPPASTNLLLGLIVDLSH
ncbi:hypothetical protein FOZ62_008793, partial [Perkinsus olseni]